MSKQIDIMPVILCGGSGKRLWPLSRKGFPKQFLVLSEKLSLFQEAVSRMNSLEDQDINLQENLIVTNEEYRFYVLDQLRELSQCPTKIFLEPKALNTAPALTLAALHAFNQGSDPILIVTPSDQLIKDKGRFKNSIKDAIRTAVDGTIVILGISPTKPETGFGYIKKIGNEGPNNDYCVSQFTEKPDLKEAKEYIKSDDYLWNSGIFVLRASIWLEALEEFRPDIIEPTLKSFKNKTFDFNFVRPHPDYFNMIPAESIDYAVMEKCPNSKFPIKIIPLSIDWNDIGSWSALWDVGSKDKGGNISSGDVITEDTKNSIVQSNHRLVATIGIENTIVVETADAVMVANKDHCQDVTKIVDKLISKSRAEGLTHLKVFRPWGWYQIVDQGEFFKVKRIQVNSGASLSLQKHNKRVEHWVVISGIANIFVDNKDLILQKNESTYIPLGVKHRLANKTDQPLIIIEVQSGSYLEEDDIVRYEDKYERK